eukprot:10278285-Alexandrium_andersonii.AAC.1
MQQSKCSGQRCNSHCVLSSSQSVLRSCVDGRHSSKDVVVRMPGPDDPSRQERPTAPNNPQA